MSALSSSAACVTPVPRARTVGEVERLYAVAMGEYAQARYLPAARLLMGLILIDPSQARFFKGMAACMQLLGRYQQASMGYATAYSLQSDDVTLLFYLAQCFAGAGGWREAGEAAQTFLDVTAGSNDHVELRAQALRLIHISKKQNQLKAV